MGTDNTSNHDFELTVELAAQLLEVSPTTVWRLAREGKLRRRRRLGRTVFDAAEVEQLAVLRGQR